MKKVLSWVLLLTLVLSLFAGCRRQETVNPTEQPEPTVSQGDIEGITAAMEYLKTIYKKTEEATLTPVDYSRFNVVRIGGVPYEIVWSVDVGEDLIKIIVNDDGTVTIDINENCEEDTPYVLTATITDSEGNSVSESWNMILPKAVDMTAIVDAAYELANGESLPYECRLRGKIISIDTIWSDDYQNITVTIAVEGREDKPIKCYRLKGDGAKDLLVGNIITVFGTIKNYNGTIEFDSGCILEAVEKGDAVEAPTDPGEILKAAYALAQDAALPYPVTLTGIVTKIDSPYDPNYGNISVVIEVEGYSQYPILCYRLKGLGVDQIAVEDQITVAGIIKNYKGTIEFDAGCQLIERISGGNIAEKPSSDPNKIIPDALALGVGESLPYRATLTGEIYSIDTPYSSQYNNITVTIKVNGYKFQCYRMVGDGIDQIRETDTITVSGIIKNYNGKLEFDTKCTLDSWVKGPRNVNYGPAKEDVAYVLYINQKTIDKTVYFNGSVSGTRLQTSDKGSKAAEVFVERVSGKGVRFFYMAGDAKKYIGIEEYVNDEGKVRGRAIVTDTPSCVWTYLSDYGVYVVNLPTAGKYFLGTYSTYETITASWTGYLDNSSNPQYIAELMEASKVPADAPTSNMIAQGTPVAQPQVGTAYKLGFQQNKLDGKPFLAFNGKMAGYYYGTAAVLKDMVDVYLETATGGYYLYIKNGNTKTYLDVVPRSDDATKVNVVLQTSGTHTVYKLNSEYQYVYTSVAGSEWYLGTYGTNSSISASNTSYISDKSTIGVSQFCAWFSTVEMVEAPEEEPTEPAPEADATLITNPALGTAYKMAMNKAGTMLYFTGNTEPGASFRLETSEDATKAVDVYLESAGNNGKVYLYYMNNGVKTYIRVYHRTDGDPGYGKGSLELVTSKPSESFVYDDVANTLIYDYDGNNAYYMGTHGDYVTVSVSNTSYITGNNASDVDVSQFPVRFYTVDLSDLPPVTEPPVTEPPAVEPSDITPISQALAASSGTFTVKGVVTLVDSSNIYVQDATGAICVRMSVKPTDIQIGDTIIGTGSRADYNGLPQLGSGTYEKSSGLTLTAKETTIGALTKADICTYIKLNNVTVTEVYDSNGTYTSPNVTVEDAQGNKIQLYKAVVGKTGGNWDVQVGDTISLYAAVSYFNKFQLRNTLTTEIGVDGAQPELPGVPGATEPEATEPGTEPPAAPSGDYVTSPAVNTAYKMAMNKAGVKLYFNGNTADKVFRLATTTNVAEAVDVKLEAAEGGYRLYFVKDGVKTYIRVYEYTKEDGSLGGSLELTTTVPAEVFTYDSTANTLFYTKGENAYYMGTYATYTTFSVSKTSFITGSGAANIDVSQFPAHFYEVSSTEPAPTEPEATEPAPTEPEATEPEVGNSATYNFSTYEKGEQFAAETHELDSVVTMSITDCHLNTQLRLYQGAVNGVNRDGIAQFASTRAVSSIVMNAGYRASDLEVYASKDGVTWELVKVVNVQIVNGTYSDYTVELPAGTKYIKLNAVSAQIRIQNMTFNFAE